MLNLLEVYTLNEVQDMHMVLRSEIKKEEVIHFADTELKQGTRTTSELIQISRQNPYLQRWSLSLADCVT